MNQINSQKIIVLIAVFFITSVMAFSQNVDYSKKTDIELKSILRITIANEEYVVAGEVQELLENRDVDITYVLKSDQELKILLNKAVKNSEYVVAGNIQDELNERSDNGSDKNNTTEQVNVVVEQNDVTISKSTENKTTSTISNDENISNNTNSPENTSQNIDVKSNSELETKTTEKRTRVIDNNYSRLSLTILYMDYGDKYSARIKNAISKINILDKFNDNQVDIVGIKAPFAKKNANCATAGLSTAFNAMQKKKDAANTLLLTQTLQNIKISNQVVAKWFSRTLDHKFSMGLIEKRGEYNATDSDFNKAKDSKRGLEDLKNQGYNLISKSYIVVLDFGNILTMKEYYDIVDAKRGFWNILLKELFGFEMNKKIRVRNGYKSDVKGYMYKVDWNASIEDQLYSILETEQDYPWIGIDKNNQFDNLNFPIKHIENTYFPMIDGAQNDLSSKTDDELFDKLVKNGMEKIMTRFQQELGNKAKKSARQQAKGKGSAPKKDANGNIVKEEVSDFGGSDFADGFSITSKITERKRNLFFPASTMKIGKKEGVFTDQRFFVYEKRENKNGEMISKKRGVIRASNKITDNKTVTDGNTVPSTFYQVAGWKLEEGMVVEEANDYGFSGMVGFGFRLDYSVTPFLAKSLGKWPTEFKLYAGFNLAYEDLSFGLSKTFHMMKNFHVSPYLGLYLNEGIDIGVRLAVNTAPWMQIEFSLGTGSSIGLKFNF